MRAKSSEQIQKEIDALLEKKKQAIIRENAHFFRDQSKERLKKVLVTKMNIPLTDGELKFIYEPVFNLELQVAKNKKIKKEVA